MGILRKKPADVVAFKSYNTPNPEVIEAAKELLRQTEAGTIQSLAFVAFGAKTLLDYHCIRSRPFEMLGMLDILMNQIRHSHVDGPWGY